MVKKQINLQESGTSNLQKLTSNIEHLPPNTSPVVSANTRRLNHHAIDKGGVGVDPSEYPVEFNSISIPDPYTTPIKSIDDYEMDHLLEFFHSEHNEDMMDVELQKPQD